MLRFLILLCFGINISNAQDFQIPKTYQDCSTYLKADDSLTSVDTLNFEKEILGISLVKLQKMNWITQQNFIKTLYKKHKLYLFENTKTPICYYLYQYIRQQEFLKYDTLQLASLKEQYTNLPKLKKGIRIWYQPSFAPVEMIELRFKQKKIVTNFYTTINTFDNSNITETGYTKEIKLIQTEVYNRKDVKHIFSLKQLLKLQSQTTQLGFRIVTKDGYSITMEVFKAKKYNFIEYTNPETTISSWSFENAHTFLKIWTKLKNQIQWDDWRKLMYHRRGY